MFLENEIWQWCPVESNFSVYNLQVIFINYKIDFIQNFSTVFIKTKGVQIPEEPSH
jgi:hypothetical protein